MAAFGEGVRIQVMVTAQTEFGEFRDAIYVTPDEFAAASDDDVAALRSSRVAAFVTACVEQREAARARSRAHALDAAEAALASGSPEVEAFVRK